jgi:hypothetical protein
MALRRKASEGESPANGNGNGQRGLLMRMFGEPGEQSAAERERAALPEWEQAVRPAGELLQMSVPGASSPEEAGRTLADAQEPALPDPQGGSWVPGDSFDRDARVYYRLLRRDYEDNPRPSRGRARSHHLHDMYGRLPGVKGW